jgi:hypothetical protein
MATLTTPPSLASDSPALLPAGRTLDPACGWFVLATWLFLTVVALGFVTLYSLHCRIAPVSALVAILA